MNRVLLNRRIFWIVRGDKGESLVTLLASLAIVGICLVGVLSSLANLQERVKTPVVPAKICRDVAQSVINSFRSSGTQPITFKAPLVYNPSSTDLDLSSLVLEPGAVSSTRFPTRAIKGWGTDSGNYESDMPRLIQGSMNALLSIYNQQGNQACTNQLGIDLVEDLNPDSPAPSPKADRYFVDASIRIQPYDLSNGSLTACQHPLWIRPKTITEVPPAEQAGMLQFVGYQDDRGLEATINVRLKDSLGANTDTTSCSVKTRFHYDRQSFPPPMPYVTLAGQVLTIKLDADDFAPGTTIMCRAHSDSPPVFGMSAASVASAWSNGSGEATRKWQSCDRLEICGQPGSVSVDAHNARIETQFSIDPLCMVEIEVQSVDAYGNTSDIKTVSAYDGSVNSGSPYCTYGCGGNNSLPMGYSVAGMTYSTINAANMAAAYTGLSVKAAVITDPVLAAQNVQAMQNLFNTANQVINNQVVSNASLAAGNLAASAGLTLTGSAMNASHSSGAFADIGLAKANLSNVSAAFTAADIAAGGTRISADAAAAKAQANPGNHALAREAKALEKEALAQEKIAADLKALEDQLKAAIAAAEAAAAAQQQQENQQNQNNP